MYWGGGRVECVCVCVDLYSCGLNERAGHSKWNKSEF